MTSLTLTIYEAANEMAQRLNDSKHVPGGTAKKAREMYRWFKLMNFTGDAEVEKVLAELNKIASRDAKTRTPAEMKEAVDASYYCNHQTRQKTAQNRPTRRARTLIPINFTIKMYAFYLEKMFSFSLRSVRQFRQSFQSVSD